MLRFCRWSCDLSVRRWEHFWYSRLHDHNNTWSNRLLMQQNYNVINKSVNITLKTKSQAGKKCISTSIFCTNVFKQISFFFFLRNRLIAVLVKYGRKKKRYLQTHVILWDSKLKVNSTVYYYLFIIINFAASSFSKSQAIWLLATTTHILAQYI